MYVCVRMPTQVNHSWERNMCAVVNDAFQVNRTSGRPDSGRSAARRETAPERALGS